MNKLREKGLVACTVLSKREIQRKTSVDFLSSSDTGDSGFKVVEMSSLWLCFCFILPSKLLVGVFEHTPTGGRASWLFWWKRLLEFCEWKTSRDCQQFVLLMSHDSSGIKYWVSYHTCKYVMKLSIGVWAKLLKGERQQVYSWKSLKQADVQHCNNPTVQAVTTTVLIQT